MCQSGDSLPQMTKLIRVQLYLPQDRSATERFKEVSTGRDRQAWLGEMFPIITLLRGSKGCEVIKNDPIKSAHHRKQFGSNCEILKRICAHKLEGEMLYAKGHCLNVNCLLGEFSGFTGPGDRGGSCSEKRCAWSNFLFKTQRSQNRSTDLMCSQRGRNGFSPNKKGFCSIT